MRQFGRTPRHRIGSLMLGAMLGLALVTMLTSSAGAVGERAVAELYDSDGQLIGLAFFEQISQSKVRVTGPVEGLTPGAHGVHIHETGTCEPPDYSSAGGHFNPTGTSHGLENPNGPHSGDLPNLTVGEDGTGWLEAESDRFSLTDGPTSLFDADGSAIVIHADEDDQRSDPSGNSGDRVVCGEISRAESVQGAPPSGDSDDGTVSDRSSSSTTSSESNGFPSLGLPELIILALVGIGLVFLVRLIL